MINSHKQNNEVTNSESKKLLKKLIFTWILINSKIYMQVIKGMYIIQINLKGNFRLINKFNVLDLVWVSDWLILKQSMWSGDNEFFLPLFYLPSMHKF